MNKDQISTREAQVSQFSPNCERTDLFVARNEDKGEVLFVAALRDLHLAVSVGQITCDICNLDYRSSVYVKNVDSVSLKSKCQVVVLRVNRGKKTHIEDSLSLTCG